MYATETSRDNVRQTGGPMASADRDSELPELEVSQPSELGTAPVEPANLPPTSDSSFAMSDSSVVEHDADFGTDHAETVSSDNLPSTRSSCKGETPRSKQHHPTLRLTLPIVLATCASGTDHPLQGAAGSRLRRRC